MSTVKATLRFVTKEFLGYCLRLTGAVAFIKYRYRKQYGLIVLNYHNFSKYNNYKINRGSYLETGYGENFERQITWLNKHFNFLTPDKFYTDSGNRGLSVFLTFDDGYKDNYDIALPILKKHGVSAAFFVVTEATTTNQWLLHDQIRYLVQTGKLNSDTSEQALRRLNTGEALRPDFLNEISALQPELPKHRLMMNWDELKEISGNDFIIGSHTHSHQPFTFLSQQERTKQLRLSIEAISVNVNQTPNYFAYPNGLYDEDCHSVMTDHHITYAFTTKPGVNTPVSSKLELKRIGVNASDSIGTLLLKLLMNTRK